MKRFIIPLVAVTVVVTIILAGCTQPAPEPTPAPAPAPAPALTTAADVPELQPLVACGSMDADLVINPYEGFAVKPDGTPYTFAMTYCFLHCDWLTNARGYFESLIHRAGAETIIHDADWSVEAQTDFIDNVITMKNADAIFIWATQEVQMAPAVDRAMDAGIPVIAVDPHVESDKILNVTWHKSDAEVGSKLAGDWFVEKARETGEHLYVFELWSTPSQDTIQDRHEGFHMGVDPYPDLVTVIEFGGETLGADEASMNAVMDAFTTNPDLNGLYVQNGGGTGAINGLDAIGKLKPSDDPDHIYLCFNDIDTRTIEALDKGDLDAVVSHGPVELTDVAVKLMFHHLILGQSVPKDLVSPMILVTADNIDTAEGKIMGIPAAWPRLPGGQFDLWPVCDSSAPGCLLSMPGYQPTSVETPTKAMRMELQGY